MPNEIELREYIEHILEVREQLFLEKIETLNRVLEEREKTLILTAKALHEKVATLNELREDVHKFVPRELWTESNAALVQRLNRLEAWQSKVLGFGSALILLAGLIGALVTQLFKS